MGRSLALAVSLVLLLLGSWRGSDDHFPFGPFLMFAGGGPTDGVVESTTLQAKTATGDLVQVPEDVSGLRRAELEGQLGRFVEQPALLSQFAVSHALLRRGEPRYTDVLVVQRRHEVRQRRVVGHTDVVLVTWRVE